MRICIRFHMSGIFDAGWANRLISIAEEYGEVTPIVTGTMGAVAMMDSLLEGKVIFVRERFSNWVNWANWVNNESFDVVLNAMHTSDVERMLADCWHLSKKIKTSLIGIETNSRTVAFYDDKMRDLAKKLADDLGFELTKGKDYGKTFWIEGDRAYRKILAVMPGDWILIDQIVVGRALTSDITVVCEKGKVVEIKGAVLKEHGLEKIGKVELSDAKIDTVRFLRGGVKRRVKVDLGISPNKGKVAYVDHAGYEVLRLLDERICCAVTIGDDTSIIVGDVLSRFGIPIIGIVDGDSEGLLQEGVMDQRSVIFRVKHDDYVGKRIFHEVFGGKRLIEGDLASIKERIKAIAKAD
ncbi:MAG: DUF2117 domain-containing protein [Candidatus Methanomethylicaceae archaeon]